MLHPEYNGPRIRTINPTPFYGFEMLVGHLSFIAFGQPLKVSLSPLREVCFIVLDSHEQTDSQN